MALAQLKVALFGEQAAVESDDRVQQALDQLDPREKEIIAHRCGLNGQTLTLEQIGERIGITKERVRQLNIRAMRKLRNMVE